MQVKIDSVILEIESSIKYLVEYEKNIQHQHFGDWEERFLRETSRLVDKNLKIRKENLVHFRGKQIFVADRPKAEMLRFYSSSSIYYVLKSIIDLFYRRGNSGIQETLDSFRSIKEIGFLDLLKKYPSPAIGSPFNYRYKGYTFTNRYIRHIYLLGLFKKYLEKKMKENSNFLDIGSSYGIFSSLIKQEMPQSHHVLVDLPGQLILAHYYLSQLFPSAKIAGFDVVGKKVMIDKDFIKEYDFVLIPTSMYGKLAANSVDIVTNFISLSEMSRYWFDAYIKSEVFKTAPFLFTVNRYDAYPTYQDNITILDYPLKDYDTIYMRTCPFLKYYYKSFMLFWTKHVRYPSEFFQYIGKRK